MKNKNIYWLLAGAINLLTALIHTFSGQSDLVNPMLQSPLNQQQKTEWLGVWHIVTAALFVSSYFLLKHSLKTAKNRNTEAIQLIGILYLLFSTAFIIPSVAMQVFAPQWTLLLPIGLLSLIGIRKNEH